jgi:hypothetical protein
LLIDYSEAHATLTGPLKSLLTNEVEFDFVDAPFIGDPAPGIAEVFNNPPYFVWNRYYSPSEVSKVHDYIRAVVAQNDRNHPPYDGIIGFSEGAALAAAVLLEDVSSIDRQYTPMFRFAVFFNAVNLLSPSTALGKKMPEIDARHAMDAFTGGSGKHQYPALDCIYTLCAKTTQTLINVPTLHVVGLKDGFRDVSEDLIKLCEGGSATTVRSPARHEMPRGRALRDVARKLDMMIEAGCMAT